MGRNGSPDAAAPATKDRPIRIPLKQARHPWLPLELVARTLGASVQRRDQAQARHLLPSPPPPVRGSLSLGAAGVQEPRVSRVDGTYLALLLNEAVQGVARSEVCVHPAPRMLVFLRNQTAHPREAAWRLLMSVGPFGERAEAQRLATWWTEGTRRVSTRAARGLALARVLAGATSLQVPRATAPAQGAASVSVYGVPSVPRLQVLNLVDLAPIPGTQTTTTTANEAEAAPPMGAIGLHDVWKGWLPLYHTDGSPADHGEGASNTVTPRTEANKVAEEKQADKKRARGKKTKREEKKRRRKKEKRRKKQNASEKRHKHRDVKKTTAKDQV